mgnify:CR=1 FL=1
MQQEQSVPTIQKRVSRLSFRPIRVQKTMGNLGFVHNVHSPSNAKVCYVCNNMLRANKVETAARAFEVPKQCTSKF